MSMFFSQGQNKNWKGDKTIVGNMSGTIRPFTNKDYTNTTTTKIGIPRPLKHYRRGRVMVNELNSNNSRFVKSSTGGTLLKQLVDIPGGANAIIQNNIDCSICNGISLVESYFPTTSLTDNPEPVTQTNLFCCNDEKKAIIRSLPTSSLLNLNSDVIVSKNNVSYSIVTNKYYSSLKQYRQGRCLTYDQCSFNFVSNVTQNSNEYIVKCNSPNQTCGIAIYKPNNQQFAQQGASKSSVFTLKKSVTTTTVSTANNLYEKSFEGTNYKNCGSVKQ